MSHSWRHSAGRRGLQYVHMLAASCGCLRPLLHKCIRAEGLPYRVDAFVGTHGLVNMRCTRTADYASAPQLHLPLMQLCRTSILIKRWWRMCRVSYVCSFDPPQMYVIEAPSFQSSLFLNLEPLHPFPMASISFVIRGVCSPQGNTGLAHAAEQPTDTCAAANLRASRTNTLPAFPRRSKERAVLMPSVAATNGSKVQVRSQVARASTSRRVRQTSTYLWNQRTHTEK